MKAIEDKAELDDWGKQGAHTTAYNNLEKHGAVVAYAQTSEKNKNTNKQLTRLTPKARLRSTLRPRPTLPINLQRPLSPSRDTISSILMTGASRVMLPQLSTIVTRNTFRPMLKLRWTSTQDSPRTNSQLFKRPSLRRRLMSS